MKDSGWFLVMVSPLIVGGAVGLYGVVIDICNDIRSRR